MNDASKQILTAAVTAVVTTTLGVYLTYYLTKKLTTESIAKGETPLPAGSTPTQTQTKPSLPDKPPPDDLTKQAVEMSQAISQDQKGWIASTWESMK